MLNPINILKNQRVISIDAFRGITFLMMIFVNELAGVHDISIWLKHMPANADAMSFPDIIFPAFLFIVGMSIPFGINYRISKGETRVALNVHILLRSFALIMMGLFMVNAEDNYHQASMSMSIQLWALLTYAAFMLVWGVYQFKKMAVNYFLKGLGIVLLIALALIYRGGSDGTQSMTIQWWGILGLIGWAYLLSCLIYQICKGKQTLLIAALILCISFYFLFHSHSLGTVDSAATYLRFLSFFDAHISHSTIVICGIICSLIFFDSSTDISQTQRFIRNVMFAIALVVIASFLRPLFGISKIYATPSWCLYSAALCIVVFSLLYWLVDLKQIQAWMSIVKPAAVNPLVFYLLPFVIASVSSLIGLPSPVSLFEGWLGILAALAYAFLMMWIVAGLNKANVRIKF